MIAQRSLVVRTGIQLASPLAVMVAAYLFFAGHNQPGGGFAAGLVLGAVVALREVVGLPVPLRPSLVLAAGGTIAGLVAVVPIVVGRPLLDQLVVSIDLPLLGTIKSGSAALFDLGVVLIVLGLLVAVLDAMGARELGVMTTSVDSPGEASADATVDSAVDTAVEVGSVPSVNRSEESK